MIEAIGSALTSMLGWLGNVVSAVVTADGELSALLPVFALAVAGTAVMFGIRVLRGFTWGA